MPRFPIMDLGHGPGQVPAFHRSSARQSRSRLEHCGWSIRSYLVLVRRRASAIANFCLLVAQTSAARPFSLSAGVTSPIAPQPPIQPKCDDPRLRCSRAVAAVR